MLQRKQIEDVVRVYFKCDEDVREIIWNMAAIVQDPNSDDQEKRMALKTIVDAISFKFGI